MCSQCQQSSGPYRCQDCFRAKSLCGQCCVSAHAQLPFHRIQMWNGRFFERSDVLTNALTLDLRHYPDDCPTISLGTKTQMFNSDLSDGDDDFQDGYQPSESDQSMHAKSRSELIIVTSNGIFKRSVQWCHCATKSEQYV